MSDTVIRTNTVKAKGWETPVDGDEITAVVDGYDFTATWEAGLWRVESDWFDDQYQLTNAEDCRQVVEFFALLAEIAEGAE